MVVLKRGQAWLGNDNQIRIIKGVVSFTVMYDVRTRTFLTGAGEVEIIETTTTETDFFQKHNCKKRLSSDIVEKFYLEEVLDEV